MKKIISTLTIASFLSGQTGFAQRKPFVFTPDKEWHYLGAGVGLPLPSFIDYEYRLNNWSYGGEIGLIHTNLLINLKKPKNSDPGNNYVRDHLKSGISYSLNLKYHFSEKINSFFIDGHIRLIKVGFSSDTPRGIINVFASDHLIEIEEKLENNEILNRFLGGKEFLDKTSLNPGVSLYMFGLSFGRRFNITKKLLFEPQILFDFKINQSAQIKFDSDSPRIDKILSNQISPYITKSLKNQNILNVLPSLGFGLRYELKRK
ncbi:MAG: hypothetical protein LCH67_19485 [Bacteroidetes bacterium]|nr:hypothetical protein [Bacteroidota bacterium]